MLKLISQFKTTIKNEYRILSLLSLADILIMNSIKIISYSESKGGAAKAARNFYNLLHALELYDVELLSVFGTRKKNEFFAASAFSNCLHYFKMIVARILMKLGLIRPLTKNSLNIFSSNYVKKSLLTACQDAQILHINWINNETISLSLLKKLISGSKHKIILTMHDEWFYCATEHCAEYGTSDFIHGYMHAEKLKKIIFNLKTEIDFSKVILTAPSLWLKTRAEESALLRGNNVFLLPNVIDTSLFRPICDLDLKHFKDDIEFPNDAICIGFGAVGGGNNPLKGFDLLIDALKIILENADYSKRICLVTFGSAKSDTRVSTLACKVLNLGKLSTPENMRDAYNLMDIMVVPSKVESFGQVAAESLACQTPVVAFDHSGTTDIVSHMKSGYLAKPFDARDLANGIMTLIDMDKCERNKYGEEGRQHIISNFSNDVIAKKYIELITK